MKRIFTFIILISLFLSFSACSTNNEPNKAVKIGVIDSCISNSIQETNNIVEINDIIQLDTNNNITHGSMILSIINQNVSNVEIFYCSILDANCVGKIENVAKAIDWCIDNNVDIITMSFATLSDDNKVKQCVERAIENNIIVIASCINLSDKICYPAMYDNVISVSEGFNSNATLILKGKKVKFVIDGVEMEKREVSFLTAYVCGKIANQLSRGLTIEKILKSPDFN